MCTIRLFRLILWPVNSKSGHFRGDTEIVRLTSSFIDLPFFVFIFGDRFSWRLDCLPTPHIAEYDLELLTSSLYLPGAGIHPSTTKPSFINPNTYWVSVWRMTRTITKDKVPVLKDLHSNYRRYPSNILTRHRVYGTLWELFLTWHGREKVRRPSM